jgi:phosphatidylglycerol:prolipoprotein diacylglycerol transferase
MEPIVWDINPVLLPIYGSFGIRWYSLCFLLGFLISHRAVLIWARESKKPLELVDSLIYYTIGGTIIGARLGHCLFYEPEKYLSDPLAILRTWEGGLASHGGYLGIIIAFFMFSRRYPSYNFLWILDRAAILSVMTGGFIRIGNLFNSEIIGKPVAPGNFGFIFPDVDQIPRHPTQIYEALGYFTIAGLLYLFFRWKGSRLRDGQVAGLGMILGYGFRFFIEQFKENQEAFEDGMFLNMGQLLSIPFVLLGFYLLLRSKENQVGTAKK